MHSKIHLTTTIGSFTLVALALLGFALLPRAQAVVPAPDGGYPNFTTAEGTNALRNLTTGAGNTAVGWYSLFSDITAGLNTGVGAGTLYFNNADANTAIGAVALLFNTTGGSNTAVGISALQSNTEGSFNTAVGARALQGNIGGSSNTATGFQALSGNSNGTFNTANGGNALLVNTGGVNNTATGYGALEFNTMGGNNTAMGIFALQDNTTGGGNTAVGSAALASNTTGGDNTALGNEAGSNITASGNVCIGAGVNGEAGAINTTWIRNVNTLTQNFSAGVNDYVTVRLTDGRLGHTAVVSSRRYKEDIKPLDKTSEGLYALKPVSFRLKKEYDETQSLGFGLIAEEVEKVDPSLVYCNNKGQAESVRYEMGNAMLLNEFLKEHHKVAKQEATIAQLKEQIEALVAHSKEQDSQIQRVHDRMQMNNPEARVALSNQ
jgi:Chaperone of endosialidase